MRDVTRYARVQASVEPLRSSGGTRVSSLRTLTRSSVEVLFRERQRVMASALREERRPGLFVFAAHVEYGHVARLWLEATALPRAGLIGRHDEVDLALPLDDSLSLRHVMFVVRRRQDGVQFVVLDLESVNGLQLESGQPVRLAEASGPLIMCASDFVFFCIPTGTAIPWNPESRDAWSTLAPRRPSRSEPRLFVPEGVAVGRVALGTPFGASSIGISRAALRRGVLVGRAPRCDAVVPIETVSRVHVVLLALGDELLAIDAGSTNGTWRRDEELRIGRLEDRDVLTLGEAVTLAWHASH